MIYKCVCLYLGYLIKVIASLSAGSPPPSGIVCIVSLLLIAAAVVALGAFIFRKKIVKPNQTFPFDWVNVFFLILICSSFDIGRNVASNFVFNPIDYLFTFSFFFSNFIGELL